MKQRRHITDRNDTGKKGSKAVLMLLQGLQVLLGFALFAQDGLLMVLDKFLRLGMISTIIFIMIVVLGVSKAENKLSCIGGSER